MRQNRLVKLIDAFLLNLERIMKFKNMTRADLARKLGVSRQQVSKLLKEDSDIKFSTVSKVADALNVDETDLLDPNLKLK